MRVGCFLVSGLLLASSGCAHHRADQYAFAPPYAPPVYPQPAGSQTIAPGTSVAAPPSVAGVPAPGAAAAPAVGGAPCDPMVQPVAMQDAPCPPGETIVPGSMVEHAGPCEPGL